mgnify:CR=1 FL=1
MDNNQPTTDENSVSLSSFQLESLQNPQEFTLNYSPRSVTETPEKARISERLKDFNPRENDAWKKITQKFGPNIKQPELISIASVLANQAKIKLDRDAKRRKSVLIKWFQEHWNDISCYLDYVVLEEARN